MGHLLGGTVQDLLVRWHRMHGRPTLWVPGLDQAGLATEVEVRKRLRKQGVDLDALSREEILGQVERWRVEHEARIREQLHAAGFSLDWSRWRYTRDELSSRATREVFVRLFQEGLIYRGDRIVNWDPKLRTAISDLEVMHTEEPADLLYLRYAWADGTPGGLQVATVRPETIFGDVAVAVHPEDDRHRSSVSRSVIVPLTGRSVPVIADPGVDPTFGNGALKVTPRHDALDYEISRRHPELVLPPTILDPGGKLVGEWVPERFQGVDRELARKQVTEALQEAGLVERTERYTHSVGRSERSEAVIEPLLSTQWFLKMKELAVPAVAGVRTGEIRIHPDRWELTFFRWMENLQDWCLSRQVATGHPIPVFYCDACHGPTASVDPPVRCPACGGERWTTDPDVLDAWFSSWLWPFSSLGWPEKTSLLDGYYPTDVLVTGRDIMFFWVARMMIAGYHFTGQRPFSDVYFTGMLRDERGRRMSKHLGNSPDPSDVIRERGADAVRFALLFPNPVDQDATFGSTTLEGARNFLTKLWNVVRFAQGQFPEGMEPLQHGPRLGPDSRLEDRWILSRWSRNASEVDAAVAGFEFTKAATLLYQFVWHDLADRYLELAKDALQGRRGEAAAREARQVLLFVLERTLRQLHPLVPHVTEELWHAIPHEGELLAVSAWPSPEEAVVDPEAEVAMEIVLESIRALRNLRAEHRVPPVATPGAWVLPRGSEERELLQAQASAVCRLAHVSRLTVLESGTPRPLDAVASVTPFGEFLLEHPRGGTTEETDALRKEREKLVGLLDKTKTRLADSGFLSRAPTEVVEETQGKAKELADRIGRIDALLAGGNPSGVNS